MNKLVLFILVSNAISFGVVYVFELITSSLGVQYFSDYFFYSMFIQLGLGVLFSFSGHKVGYSDPSHVAGVVASSLIDNESSKSTVVTKLEATGLGGKFLFSAIFALLFCFVV
ncbi:hypothetical protein QNF00_004609 [Vibrio alginolyticus]|nr:hypothetical protein [Vibrio alginolyticus]ELB2876652.1 hypothetical protein [Vibrio alginolyticus]ELB2948432.1 hypothetical protein [Vibrio alginolyticus]